MNVENLPWQNGIAAVFATVLIGIFIDLAYRKLPKEAGRLRRLLRQQNEIIETIGVEQAKELHDVKEKMEEMNVRFAMLIKRQQTKDRKKKPSPKRRK